MRIFFAVLLFAIGLSVSAAEIRCDNCSEATYQSRAIQAGVGTHYVYDLVKGNSRKFTIERSCEEGMQCSFEVYSEAVERDVVTVVLELTAYRAATVGSMSSNFTIYADGDVAGITAFDVAGPGGPRSQVIDWMNSTKVMSIRNALPLEGAILHNMFVTAINIFKNNIGKTNVTVVFSDGSKFTLEFESVNGTFTVIEGSAVDEFGNIIPAQIEQLNGLRFDYSRDPGGPAQQRMEAYLKVFGVKVTGSTKWVCGLADGHQQCYPF